MKNFKVTDKIANKNVKDAHNSGLQSKAKTFKKGLAVKRIATLILCAMPLIFSAAGCGYTDKNVDVPMDAAKYITVTETDVGATELYPLGFYDKKNDIITASTKFSVKQTLNVKNLRELTKLPASGDMLYLDIAVSFSDGKQCNAFFESLDFSLNIYEQSTLAAAVSLNAESLRAVEVGNAIFKYEATKTAVDAYHVYISLDVSKADVELLVLDLTYTLAPTTERYQAIYLEVGNGGFSTLSIDSGITDYKTF